MEEEDDIGKSKRKIDGLGKKKTIIIVGIIIILLVGIVLISPFLLPPEIVDSEPTITSDHIDISVRIKYNGLRSTEVKLVANITTYLDWPGVSRTYQKSVTLNIPANSDKEYNISFEFNEDYLNDYKVWLE
ncbi:MAG: hypothetical protein R6U61_05360 [Thermoplasmata archaeon]